MIDKVPDHLGNHASREAGSDADQGKGETQNLTLPMEFCQVRRSEVFWSKRDKCESRSFPGGLDPDPHSPKRIEYDYCENKPGSAFRLVGIGSQELEKWRGRGESNSLARTSIPFKQTQQFFTLCRVLSRSIPSWSSRTHSSFKEF
jgi:hypothetical protein